MGIRYAVEDGGVFWGSGSRWTWRGVLKKRVWFVRGIAVPGILLKACYPRWSVRAMRTGKGGSGKATIIRLSIVLSWVIAGSVATAQDEKSETLDWNEGFLAQEQRLTRGQVAARIARVHKERNEIVDALGARGGMGEGAWKALDLGDKLTAARYLLKAHALGDFWGRVGVKGNRLLVDYEKGMVTATLSFDQGNRFALVGIPGEKGLSFKGALPVALAVCEETTRAGYDGIVVFAQEPVATSGDGGEGPTLAAGCVLLLRRRPNPGFRDLSWRFEETFRLLSDGKPTGSIEAGEELVTIRPARFKDRDIWPLDPGTTGVAAEVGGEWVKVKWKAGSAGWVRAEDLVRAAATERRK